MILANTWLSKIRFWKRWTYQTPFNASSLTNMENGTIKAPDPSQRVPALELLPHSSTLQVSHLLRRPVQDGEYYDQNPLLTDAVILQVRLCNFLIHVNSPNTLEVRKYTVPCLSNSSGSWEPFLYSVIWNSWYQE